MHSCIQYIFSLIKNIRSSHTQKKETHVHLPISSAPHPNFHPTQADPCINPRTQPCLAAAFWWRNHQPSKLQRDSKHPIILKVHKAATQIQFLKLKRQRFKQIKNNFLTWRNNVSGIVSNQICHGMSPIYTDMLQSSKNIASVHWGVLVCIYYC